MLPFLRSKRICSEKKVLSVESDLLLLLHKNFPLLTVNISEPVQNLWNRCYVNRLPLCERNATPRAGQQKKISPSLFWLNYMIRNLMRPTWQLPSLTDYLGAIKLWFHWKHIFYQSFCFLNNLSNTVSWNDMSLCRLSPGADITDYFNYGFTEDTWKIYSERQKALRQGIGVGDSLSSSSVVKSLSTPSRYLVGIDVYDCYHISSTSHFFDQHLVWVRDKADKVIQHLYFWYRNGLICPLPLTNIVK